MNKGGQGQLKSSVITYLKKKKKKKKESSNMADHHIPQHQSSWGYLMPTADAYRHMNC